MYKVVRLKGIFEVQDVTGFLAAYGFKNTEEIYRWNEDQLKNFDNEKGEIYLHLTEEYFQFHSHAGKDVENCIVYDIEGFKKAVKIEKTTKLYFEIQAVQLKEWEILLKKDVFKALQKAIENHNENNAKAIKANPSHIARGTEIQNILANVVKPQFQTK